MDPFWEQTNNGINFTTCPISRVHSDRGGWKACGEGMDASDEISPHRMIRIRRTDGEVWSKKKTIFKLKQMTFDLIRDFSFWQCYFFSFFSQNSSSVNPVRNDHKFEKNQVTLNYRNVKHSYDIIRTRSRPPAILRSSKSGQVTFNKWKNWKDSQIWFKIQKIEPWSLPHHIRANICHPVIYTNDLQLATTFRINTLFLKGTIHPIPGELERESRGFVTPPPSSSSSSFAGKEGFSSEVGEVEWKGIYGIFY